jgi:hypothetical protein
MLGLRFGKDAGTVFKRAWSVRFLLLSMFFTALEVCLPLLSATIAFPPAVSIGLSIAAGVSAALALLTRHLVQVNMKDDPQ